MKLIQFKMEHAHCANEGNAPMANSQNLKTISTADHEAAKAALDGYIEGLETGSFTRIADSFWENATMTGVTPAGFVEGSWRELEGYVEQFGAAPEQISHVDVVSITPTSALIRIDIENLADGTDCTDFHTVVKKDGAWKVIAKVFHVHG
ncbi:nuclear transport factor 2 family protein [Microbacterium sp. 22303]|uniref:nuclear transport factor 2 family protein n=1 Tax=Microbacterium sp. 22303 TaxID=3453905 RepID=UPI003F86D3D1